LPRAPETQAQGLDHLRLARHGEQPPRALLLVDPGGRARAGPGSRAVASRVAGREPGAGMGRRTAMRLVAEIRERLRAIFFLSREDRELDEELRFHLDMQTEEYTRRGMDPAEARRQAVLRLGGLAQVREATRDARGVRWLDDVVADTRYAFRTLLRRPIFTAAAAGTLALGIGGTTAIFGIVDALFLRPPTGVRGADTLARIYIVRDEGGIRTPDGGPGSYVDYLAMRDNAHGFWGVAVSLVPP